MDWLDIKRTCSRAFHLTRAGLFLCDEERECPGFAGDAPMKMLRKFAFAGVVVVITSAYAMYLQCASYNDKTLVLLNEVGGWYQFQSGPPEIWEWPWYWNMLEDIEIFDPSSQGVPRMISTKPLQFWPPAELEQKRVRARVTTQQELGRLLAYAPCLCRLRGLAIRQPIKNFDPNTVIALKGIKHVHLVFETMPDSTTLKAVAKKMPDAMLVVNGKSIKAD